MLVLKEFDEDRGEHIGVNIVDLPCERVAAGVGQDPCKRVGTVVHPGVARTAIYNEHRHRDLDPAIKWERFALHNSADKRRVVGKGLGPTQPCRTQLSCRLET